MSDLQTLLILPHLRLQNANAISSPMTWGFPAMSAFVGAMQALERKLPDDLDVIFTGVGVICHDFEAQVTHGGFTRNFRLTRNPVNKDGSTAAIVEEGRVHLDVTLVFAVEGNDCTGSEQGQEALAQIARTVSEMRIAGGSVMAPLPGGKRQMPYFVCLDDDPSERARQFLKLKRRWLPGFTLVSRDDLLMQRLAELREQDPQASTLDAWLDCAGLNMQCAPDVPTTQAKGSGDDPQTSTFSWQARKSPGWIVPIPIGYGAISPCHEAGSVDHARDTTTPFRFVESLYSLGQWVSPHRLRTPDELLWFSECDPDAGLYRLRNHYRPNNNR